MSAMIAGWRRAWASTLRVSRNGRMRSVRTFAGPSACSDSRIVTMINAATTKLAALARNAASRPKATVNKAPSPAPTASIAPQVAPIIDVAVARSSSSTMLGIPACAAGPKNEPSAVTPPCATNTIHGIPCPANKNRSAAAAWADDARIRTLRRSKRSATGPAIGPITNVGNVCATQKADARKSEPVASSNRPIAATAANQSPP